MTEDLSISIIQANLAWEDVETNLQNFKEKIHSIQEQTDLIVLPEMFNTGFTMNAADFYEEMNGRTMQWMQEQASIKNAVITGSIIIKSESKYYNRLIWMRPDGSYDIYDKRHLFRLSNEQLTYSPGQIRKIVTIKNWKINLNICYDLRFPVWSRNSDAYDVTLYVANWPEKRNNAWKILLRARAIENICYAIGVNRVGNDGNNIYHSGDSAIVHPDGTAIAEASNKEAVITETLSIEALLKFRERFSFHKDADTFEIKN